MIEFATTAAGAMLALALALASTRVFLGPSLPDRVVALDMIAFVAVGLVILSVLRTREFFLLDVAFVFALLTFLATVAFARFLEEEKKAE